MQKSNINLKLLFLVCISFLTCEINAQLNATTIGDATDLGNNCYRITPDLLNQSGGVWYDNPIDFDEDFTIYYQNNFGTKDANGADGMALVFKRDETPVIGGLGGGLGYDGITESLIVEFDTFFNGENNDLASDHVAILRDGVPNHGSGFNNLVGPFQASPTSANIEDGVDHEIKIQWNATTQIFDVYFDCDLRLSLNLDIKANIFSNDDTVFFGFVGSTGGLSNLHQVCFNSITFVDNLLFEDQDICLGDGYNVDATVPSGDTYTWSPTLGVSNPNIPNPTLSPTVTTTYTVTISDACGETTTENITINVFPVETPIFDPIAPICEGDALAPLPTTSNNGITGTWSPALDNTTTTTYTFTPDNNQCSPETTLEIVVNPFITPTFPVVAPICDGAVLAPLPVTSNEGITGTWSPALDNTATTTYTFTPDAGQGCVLPTTLEIVVNPNFVPQFDGVTAICDGDALSPLPTTSNDGITGTWAPALDNTTTTTYTFTPDAGQGCALAATLEIVVIPNITPQFDVVAPICDGDALAPLPTTSNDGITGTWSPALDNTTTTTYTFTPDAGQGCALETTLEIVVIPNITPLFDAVAPICIGDPLAPLPTISNNGITGTWAPALDATATTIYTFTPDAGQGCVLETTLEIIVNPLPVVVVPFALEVCDDGTPDGLTSIDLSLKNAEISGSNPNYAVSYYLTLAEAQGGINPLGIPYTNISNPQTVFVRVEDVTTGCYDTTLLDLVVEQAPVAFPPAPLRYCDPDNDGFGVFTLTDANAEITGGVGDLVVTYHETLANAQNGVDAIDTNVDYNNIVADGQILYARVESQTIATDCETVVMLELIVEPSPQIEDPEPLEACDDASADGFAVFDLTSKADEVLNGLDAMQYVVSYYLTELDAIAGMNPIATPNAYTNTNAGSQVIWIRVEDTATVEGCFKVTSLELIVNPLPILTQPSPLELCDVDNPGDEQEAFTLEDANAEILAGQTGITLTYYQTQLDADNGTNAIASPYVNTSNAQTVYVRGENDITGCYSTITLTLRVDPVPSPEPDPTPIEVCDDDNDGFAEFDLEIRTQEIINNETDVVITYHETQEQAEQGDNPIASPYTNIVAGSQMIYVRSENTITGCYSLTQNTLELIVVASPEVPLDIDPLVNCDDDGDGITQFDLTVMDGIILGTQDPLEVALTYHVSEADAQTGDNPIVNVTNYTNVSNPQTLYIRLYNPTTDCLDTGEFELQVELPPVPVQPEPLELCDDLGEVPGDEMTVFDLTVKDVEITGGNGSWSVSYYETEADAQGQTNVIADPTQYTNTSIDNLPANPQTLYVVVTDTDTGCVAFTTMTIRVLPNPTPTPSDQLPELVLCDVINAGDGVELFDLTENEELILNGEAGVTASYHESAEDADAGVNAIADPAQYINAQSPEQQIYVRVTNDVTGCYALVDFTIRVDPLPEVVAVTDFIQCELNTDGFDSFDLTTKDTEVLNGQDPTLFAVTYHETLVDAESGVNALVSPYTNISNPQEIYVTITNTETGCSISTQRFNLQVDEAAQANPDMEVIVYELCDDNMETDGDPSDDSVQFDLTLMDAEILDAQDPTDYIVSYYASEADANLSVNPLPTLYENITNPQVIYARVDNNTLTVAPIALDLSALTGGLDLDANGTIDTFDTDGDGVFDLVDVDGDGLSDAIDDGDGLIDFVDTDGDGQGDPVDLDNDGVFDNLQDGSICFAVAELTLQVNPLPNLSFEESYILCVNTNGTEILEPLVLDTGLSAMDYSFEWSFNGTILAGETGATLTPTQGGSYSVTVTDISTSTVTSCTNTVITEVIESEPPVLTAEVTTQAFADNHVIVAQATGPGDYEYSLDGGPWQSSGTFTGVSTGLHEVTARDRNGCGIAVVEVFVLDYPRYFTPNGDGNHETWNIAGIGNSAKIYIFDRYGKLLKQLSPSGPGWNGTYNGNRMPTGDYWFVVEYDEPTTGQRKELRAHFTLKR